MLNSIRVSIATFLLWGCMLTCSISIFAQPGQYIVPTWSNFSGSGLSSTRDKIAGTFFFYWHDNVTGFHMGDHHIHPRYDYNSLPFSFRSEKWWQTELNLVGYTGLDWVMLDYWANPQNLWWSNDGLNPINEALDNLEAERKPIPKVAMFFDTTSLSMSSDYFPTATDLATAEGRKRFYNAIRDFYSRIKPNRWARINGRVPVILYRGREVKNPSKAAFDEIDSNFAKDFGGLRLFFIGSADWKARGVPISLTWEWGAAAQPNCTRITSDNVAGVAPGYTASISGRVIRDRLNGDTYRKGWEAVLKSKKRYVFIETWNELHESTGILPTIEYGTREMHNTRSYVKTFHSQ